MNISGTFNRKNLKYPMYKIYITVDVSLCMRNCKQVIKNDGSDRNQK